MSTFLFALDYVLESLQKSRLYVSNKKLSITRENAFLRQIELFLVKSNIDSNRRKTYSLASKTSSELRDKHFCADNYFPELLRRTKLCGNDKSVPNQKINTLMRLVTCQSDFDTHNSSNSVS